jgi:hypothetical protein
MERLLVDRVNRHLRTAKKAGIVERAYFYDDRGKARPTRRLTQGRPQSGRRRRRRASRVLDFKIYLALRFAMQTIRTSASLDDATRNRRTYVEAPAPSLRAERSEAIHELKERGGFGLHRHARNDGQALRFAMQTVRTSGSLSP